ncbi:MAG: DnaJ domain-containing protein [Verrucomicrobiota bacterium]|nr:DnaJ domain-containing protein [Verrucomicrobiota bacterium]
MTDYFVLLGQCRSPWLDPEELKQAFHAKTLRQHPDVQGERQNDRSEGAFAELNEAYQALRDPKRRLHHLLNLEGNAVNAQTAAIPRDLEALFPTIAELTHAVDALAQRLAATSNQLVRSLARPELTQTKTRLEETLATLTQLHESALTELKAARETWSADDVRDLYFRFSYLTRWMTQLKEKQLQLNV